MRSHKCVFGWVLTKFDLSNKAKYCYFLCGKWRIYIDFHLSVTDTTTNEVNQS